MSKIDTLRPKRTIEWRTSLNDFDEIDDEKDDEKATKELIALLGFDPDEKEDT
jgi:hypothetical protein